MKVCIFGAGAIGGYMGVKLAKAGADVSLVARGPHLAAMQEQGLTLIEEGETTTVPVTASDDPAALGVQDYVIVTLKAHSVPPVVSKMAPLIGPNTTIVSGVNGVPWWYFHKLEGAHEGTRLDSVDPGNVQWDGFGPDRVLGCVVYPAAEVIEPGVIKHIEGNRFSLGEPDGSKSERAQALSKILANAGLKAPVRPKLRDEIWVKLWGNLSFNPISALTHATLDVLCTDEGTRAVARNMMVEAQEIAERLGVKFPIDVDRRIAGGAAVGAHRTSMLQDLDQGRPMEIDALVASVQELGRVTGVPTPTIDTVLGLIRLRARTAGLYSEICTDVGERNVRAVENRKHDCRRTRARQYRHPCFTTIRQRRFGRSHASRCIERNDRMQTYVACDLGNGKHLYIWRGWHGVERSGLHDRGRSTG